MERQRPGSKHLCGQTCLHKLVDEFMARTLQARAHPAGAGEDDLDHQLSSTNASLTSEGAYGEIQSSARLITPPSPALPMRPLFRPPVELVAMPLRQPANEPAPRSEEPPIYMSRQWRAEAWEREREREMHAAERLPQIALRRRSS